MPSLARLLPWIALAAATVVLAGGTRSAEADEVFDDALKQLNVEARHVPSDAAGAGQMLLEFKRKMVLLEQRVRGRLANAHQIKGQTGATDAEVRAFKDQILESAKQVGKRLARELRDPAMARMVAQANQGRPQGRRIRLAAGTSPGDDKYRGGWGDIDLEGHPTAVDAFKKVFDQAGISERTAHKGGYVSYEEIDVTLHRMAGALGEPGSGAHRTQISSDAATKETYVSAAMKDGQPGRLAVVVHDHIKKAHAGSKLAPDQLLRNREALQSFAKGTLKAIRTAGLGDKDLKAILQKAGVQGSVQEYRQRLEALKSGGYAIAPGEIGLDVDTIRAFKEASLEALSACDRRTWGEAQQEMSRVRQRVKELRATGNPADARLATELKAQLLDSETRLNEVFKANKDRFGFLSERSKIKAILALPRVESIRFSVYMSETKLGRGIVLTMLMELAKSNPRMAKALIDELPPHARERLRGEADFRAFQADLEQTTRPFWKRDVEMPKLVAAWQGRINRLNQDINARIQGCAATRGFAQGMSVYGKVSEAQAYWSAWERGGPEAMIVEIIRRRIPYASTVEYAMLGNYWMAGWDVVITLVPPAGLLQAAFNIGMSIGQYGVEYVQSAEHLAFEEQLYRTALFELEGVTSLEQAKLGTWKLLQVRIGERTVPREDLLAGRVILPYATQRMVEDADPVLRQIREMSRHPLVGERLYGRYLDQYEERRKRVMAWWGRKTVEGLELRKSVQDAWARGMLPAMYAELARVTTALGIRAQVDAAMDKALGQGLLDPLRQMVKDALFRDAVVQGTQQPSLREQEAGELVVRHLEAYRKVLAARERVEQHGGLQGTKDVDLRLLSGPDLLTADPKRDRRTAEAWSSRGLLHATAGSLELEAIRARHMDSAGRVTAYDQQALSKLVAHRLWIDAWKEVAVNAGSIPARPDRAAQAVRRRKFHVQAVDALLAAYDKHYTAMTMGSLVIRVREVRGGTPTERNIPRSIVAAGHKAGGGVQLPAMGGGRHVVRRIPLGRWSWIVRAAGYATADGKDRAEGSVELTADQPHQEVLVDLHAQPDVIRLRVVDDRGRPVPGVSGTLEDQTGRKGALAISPDGFVHATDVYRGTWRATVEAPGYAPTTSAPIIIDPAGGKHVTPQPVAVRMKPFRLTLALRVVDERDLPVEGVAVRLQTRKGTTDAAGWVRFELDRPVHGGWMVLKKTGFAPVRGRATFIPTKDGEVLERRQVLGGGVALKVRVLESESKAPVRGAGVHVSSLDTHAAPKTDAQGYVTVKNLPPDFVHVGVTARGFVAPPGEEIDLRGKSVGAVVLREIHVDAGMRLHVHVKDPAGFLIPGAHVQLDDQARRFAPTGTAELSPVRAGAHRIRAVAPGWAGVEVAYTAVPAAGAAPPLTITLPQGATIRGRVIDETGGLYRAAATRLELHRDGRIVARARGPLHLFANLAPGRYTLVGHAGGGAFATSEPILLGPAPADEELTVRLSAPGLLRVWVDATKDGKVVAEPRIRIAVEGQGRSRTDRGRLGVFAGMTAGTYTVTATAPGYAPATTQVVLSAPQPGDATDLRLVLKAGDGSDDGAADTGKTDVGDAGDADGADDAGGGQVSGGDTPESKELKQRLARATKASCSFNGIGLFELKQTGDVVRDGLSATGLPRYKHGTVSSEQEQSFGFDADATWGGWKFECNGNSFRFVRESRTADDELDKRQTIDAKGSSRRYEQVTGDFSADLSTLLNVEYTLSYEGSAEHFVIEYIPNPEWRPGSDKPQSLGTRWKKTHSVTSHTRATMRLGNIKRDSGREHPSSFGFRVRGEALRAAFQSATFEHTVKRTGKLAQGIDESRVLIRPVWDPKRINACNFGLGIRLPPKAGR